MREINILGLRLRDYTLREKMRLVDAYLRSGKLNTITYVSTQILMSAEKDPQEKQWLEAVNIVVYCDADIARAAGVTARKYLKEIENNSFLKELLRKLVCEKYPIYLLSDSEENMEALESELERLQGMAEIAGKRIFREDEEETGGDIVINDINDKAPGAVLSLLGYPRQEAFLFHNRDKINTDIWVGLHEDSPVLGGEEKGTGALLKKLQKRVFQRKVHQYENQEKTEL